VAPDNLDRARALQPFYEREVFGRVVMIFERQADLGRPAADLASLGEMRTPSIADLFVAKMEAA
jgi:ABC-2 type transport system ATP-binding protein